MKSLLDAIQEGRLVELAVSEKDKALQILGMLMEAIPDIGSGQDLVEAVLKREADFNSGIGRGIACPHVRSAQKGELLCAVGWSPQGIDYGASDGQKVHLVIMYYIPDTEKNEYLKEVSGLAKAVSTSPDIQKFAGLTEISDVRKMLLDWVEFAIDKAVPDSMARMIKLEERQRTAEAAKTVLGVIPFRVIMGDQSLPMILSNDPSLGDTFENSREVMELLRKNDSFEFSSYHVTVLERQNYLKNRIMFNCVGIKLQ
jgi:mannitol/fructose-specific phosphotransferase system IIA component (Ntr-type)